MLRFHWRTATLLAAGAAALVALAPFALPRDRAAFAATSEYCAQNGVALQLEPTMPPTFNNHRGADGQPLANCSAWQEFIYLNWPAVAGETGIPNRLASPSQFGVPGSQRTVWVSYDRPVNIFPTPGPNAARPTAASIRSSGRNPRDGHLVFGGTGEFINNEVQFSSTEQAFSDGWIAAQGTVRASNGTTSFTPLVFYDIWVDTDEEQYILKNDLEYVVPQSTCAGGPVGLSLPSGNNDRTCAGKAATYGQGIGAIEVKAALLDLGPYPLDANKRPCAACAAAAHPTFFLFPEPVDLVYPNVGLQTSRLTGLVGLHIIRKLPGADRMLWATFEHVKNDPDTSQATQGGWTFFNPKSNAEPNVNPNPCPTTGCYYGPTQILREMAITRAREATADVDGILPPTSVFRYYELVDVQWPATNFPLVPGAQVPADEDAYGPPIVANTVLETFFQAGTSNPSSCIGCHRYGSVAAPPSTQARLFGAAHRGGRLIKLFPPHRVAAAAGATAQPTGQPYASDFSFIFGDASVNAPPGSMH
jgi:hypothetical protein